MCRIPITKYSCMSQVSWVHSQIILLTLTYYLLIMIKLCTSGGTCNKNRFIRFSVHIFRTGSTDDQYSSSTGPNSETANVLRQNRQKTPLWEIKLKSNCFLKTKTSIIYNHVGRTARAAVPRAGTCDDDAAANRGDDGGGGTCCTAAPPHTDTRRPQPRARTTAAATARRRLSAAAGGRRADAHRAWILCASWY